MSVNCLDRPEDFEFVKALERFPCIWDKNHPDHKNRDAKIQALKEISYCSGVFDPSTKYKAIRDKFVRRSNFDKARRALPWPLECRLGFLKNNICKRVKSSDNTEDGEASEPLELSSILEMDMKTDTEDKEQIIFFNQSDQPSSSQPTSHLPTITAREPPHFSISSATNPVRIAPKRNCNMQPENQFSNGVTTSSLPTYTATQVQKLSGVKFRETSTTADDINMAFGRVVGLSLKSLPKQTAARLRGTIMALLSEEEIRQQ